MSIHTDIYLDGKKISDAVQAYQRINLEARPFPSYLLPKNGTALSLFSAAFHGVNDVIHFARTEMAIDCVDINGDKLMEMAEIYRPRDLTFHVYDAWQFAELAFQGKRSWDVVTVDCFFDDDTQKVWDSLHLWLSLTNTVCLITSRPDTEWPEVFNWKQSYFPRGHDVGWQVFRSVL